MNKFELDSILGETRKRQHHGEDNTERSIKMRRGVAKSIPRSPRKRNVKNNNKNKNSNQLQGIQPIELISKPIINESRCADFLHLLRTRNDEIFGKPIPDSLHNGLTIREQEALLCLDDHVFHMDETNELFVRIKQTIKDNIETLKHTLQLNRKKSSFLDAMIEYHCGICINFGNNQDLQFIQRSLLSLNDSNPSFVYRPIKRISKPTISDIRYPFTRLSDAIDYAIIEELNHELVILEASKTIEPLCISFIDGFDIKGITGGSINIGTRFWSPLWIAKILVDMNVAWFVLPESLNGHNISKLITQQELSKELIPLESIYYFELGKLIFQANRFRQPINKRGIKKSWTTYSMECASLLDNLQSIRSHIILNELTVGSTNNGKFLLKNMTITDTFVVHKILACDWNSISE